MLLLLYTIIVNISLKTSPIFSLRLNEICESKQETYISQKQHHISIIYSSSLVTIIVRIINLIKVIIFNDIIRRNIL